ncbi:MAG: SDR family oxidoreductase [Pedosphaera sp.]|nr:SDR family oxidoreductase [Pedosphaera sp.]
MFSLKEKITLVTGAGSGIGASVAEVFAKAGAFVFVTDRDEVTGRQTAALIAAQGGQAEFLPLDVASEADCERVTKTVLDRFARLDVLVNNAGIGHVGTMLTTTGADLDRLYSVNVRGMFNMSKGFLPGMIARKSGSIVNMASIGGVVAVKDRLAYCTSKFAVVGMTKALALDHARDGVRVNCVCPGRVETPFVSNWIKKYSDPEAAYRMACETQAVGRMARPEEIAHAALYLASDESSFMTGAEFKIDGGFSVGK